MGAYCTIAPMLVSFPHWIMPMATSPPETPDNDTPPKSRLDRELEEILSKNDNIRHLPPPPRPKRARPLATSPGPAHGLNVPPQVRRLMGTAIIQALVLAVLALLVRDVSPLLASLLCLAAVVCIILPMVQRFRRPASPPETRMWRGQLIDVQPRSEGQSPLEGVRDWWRSRRG